MENKREFKGFVLYSDNHTWGPCMILKGPWMPEFTDTILAEGVTELRLSEAMGWVDSDISFIAQLTALRGIGIYSQRVIDLSALSTLRQLEFIGLDCHWNNRCPDFPLFLQLKACSLRWRKGAESLFNAESVRNLNIVNFPYADFSSFAKLRNLSELKLTSSTLKSFLGIVALAKLTSLDLYKCPKLKNVSGLVHVPSLTKLEFELCKHIFDLTPLGGLSNLVRLDISNCGRIKSLSPLRQCKKLEDIFFIEDTYIEDGDLSFFKDLPNFRTMWYRDRKHYSHRRDDIGLPPKV